MSILRHYTALTLLFFLAGLLGCRPVEPTELPPFDGQKAFREVEALVAITPRDAGTPGGLKAAEHILQRLESFGLNASMDTFTDKTPAGEKVFRNVIGRIPGKSNRWIILGSHFDTKAGINNFQGANDSGSSTGVLLELARMVRAHHTTPEVGILFAFFDGEESVAGYLPGDGLHGSRRMVAQLTASGDLDHIEAMILLDMVGDPDLHFSIPANSSHTLVAQLLDAAHTTGHRRRFSLSPPGHAIIDDHVPFLEAGIPAIDIIDFAFGSKPGLNDYWHTEADNIDHIDAASLQITGEVVLQLLHQVVF